MVQKISARAQARSILIEQMVHGKLEPGERLNETILAKQLGVSQTPIREALLGLEGQGYVISRADRGFFVKEMSVSEIKGIYPVLAELESSALKAVRTFPDELLDELDDMNGDFVNSRGEHSIDLDNQWHQLLLSNCENQYLLECIARVRDDVHRYENRFFREGGNIANSSAHHYEITNLLRSNKKAQACNALKKNNLHAIELMCAWLETKKQTEELTL